MSSKVMIASGKQQGFSIVFAIFVLVVLSLLATAMFNIMAAGSDTVARQVLSARALFAAESGAQRQLNAIFPPGASASVTASCAGSAGSPRTNTFSMGGLIGCSDVIVVCDYVLIDAVNYFSLTSTGRCGPADDSAVRAIEVRAK
jgi:MSHA biogenesis protein MshP